MKKSDEFPFETNRFQKNKAVEEQRWDEFRRLELNWVHVKLDDQKEKRIFTPKVFSFALFTFPSFMSQLKQTELKFQ